MRRTTRLLILCAAVGACLSGCATSRWVVAVPDPDPEPLAAAAYPRELAFRAVTDDRVFVAKPAKPSEPSAGFEGAKEADPELLARIVMRMVNGFGMMMGDVRLSEEQTVATVVTAYMREALAGVGIKVVDAAAARPDTLLLDVHVSTFWSWMEVSLTSVKVYCAIGTDIMLSGVDDPVYVEGQAMAVVNLEGTKTVILNIIKAALADYQANLRTAVASFPLE